MKRSRYSVEQVAYALRQAETGTSVADVCRQLGISDATFYVWKKYANRGATELREENAKLKRLVGLQLRHRVRRRKHGSLHRGIPAAASRAHERWTMGLVHDARFDGRASRVLTVVDQWSCWSPILEVAQGMSGTTVAEAPDRAIAGHGAP
jgi:putative transposase